MIFLHSFVMYLDLPVCLEALFKVININAHQHTIQSTDKSPFLTGVYICVCGTVECFLIIKAVGPLVEEDIFVICDGMSN